ncbi:MAG TPA: type II CAAX endopeptidase family protein [Candidatus Angelobacter sp.]|nr:type II CAAX endopeptidase family protein [Candidatus Angelobacter sp.]
METSTARQSADTVDQQSSPIQVSNQHRWIDLALVMTVAFSSPLLGSLFLLVRPNAYNFSYSNVRLITAISQEITALAVFFCLFRRQGRRLGTLGFEFQWTDLFKGLGLFTVALIVMGVFASATRYLWFIATLQTISGSHNYPSFSSASLWLVLPFLLLNPFCEEVLVRGYLMTEIIDLRGSVILAMLISLVLQTSYHLYYGVFGALTVGSGLAVLVLYYGKSRRLMPVILAHCLWDLTALIPLWRQH